MACNYNPDDNEYQFDDDNHDMPESVDGSLGSYHQPVSGGSQMSLPQNLASSGYKMVDNQYHNAKRFAWKHLGWVLLILALVVLYWLYTHNYFSTLSAKLETLSPKLTGGSFNYQPSSAASYYVDRMFMN